MSTSKAFTAAQPRPIWPRLSLSLTWFNHVAVALLVPAGLLLLWHLAGVWQWVSPQILPPPTRVWNTFVELTLSGDLASELSISLGRVLVGVVLGVIAGLALGLLMGLSRQAEAYLLPLFQAISQVPVLGWIPLLMMLVGIDETLKYLVIAKAVLVPMTINTFAGIRNIPASYLEVAQVYRFNLLQRLSKVIIPGALPSLFTGLRFALTKGWVALVTVEMLASSEGIGYLMVDGRQMFQLDLVIVTMLVIGLVGLLLDKGLALIETRLQRWQRQAF
ncbi:ABC transporter permease subunit [Pseudomonas helleri]|uniref:ABC transporter permease subunit n=1 Tax=Pseudomonas helleri TaxID=1608996 RepID=A0A7X1XB08_9PSED|nr:MULTISPECIES: ABC transporter permease [Pseudomonas]MQT46173.1 ABC transporter permease subunit [Pseudomonas helleri]MQT57309.1 ABC transporter permease subunit [Pseudomonas sp. FSL R10-0399]MQT88257.1 ABC transporter permease subunit [Pseudomonas helleri]